MPSPERSEVKVTSGALDIAQSGDIILRGVIDPLSLRYIRADDYQREVLPLPAQASLIAALKANKPVPDIVIGMRGGDYIDSCGSWFLRDPVYVIDGLQRISAARHLMLNGEHAAPRLGATIHFNTTRESERDLFKALNTKGVKLSQNILLRNRREDSEGIQVLFGLSEDATSPLYDRVCWMQRQRRREIMTARVLLQTATYLHSSFVAHNANHSDLAIASLDRLVCQKVGRKIVAGNLREFYDVVDAVWGIRNVTFATAAVYLRGRFLCSLARFFAMYRDFWDESLRFSVPVDIRRKLKLFPLNDPLIKALAGSASGGLTGAASLVNMLADHVNSGKRTKRLTPFKPAEDTKGTDSNA